MTYLRAILTERAAGTGAGWRSLALGLLALLFAGLASGAARAQDPSELVGSWRSQAQINGWLGFVVDVTATGDPARPLRAVGAIGRDRLFESSCAAVAATDRWASGVCETIDKDGPVPFDIRLAPASGAGGYSGVDARTGATIRLSRMTASAVPQLSVEVERPRADGSVENWLIPPVAAWPDRQNPRDLVGGWIGEVDGLTIEANVTRVADDRVSVELRYFPEGAGAAPGRVLGGIADAALKARPFSMRAELRHMPGRGAFAAYAGEVRQPPEEWEIGHGHFAQIRLPMNANLEMSVAGTRDDLISLRTQTINMRPLGRAMRPVPPIPSPFAGMSGLWAGAMGPLTVELDIAVREENGALTGEIRHFDEGGGFPPNGARGFGWAHEVANKARPFAAGMLGMGREGVAAVEGRVDTGDQGDIGWRTAFRLSKSGDEHLLLDYAIPNQPVEFLGPPIRLSRLAGDLRPVDVPVPAAQSGLAGIWAWRSGAGEGHDVVMALEEADGALQGRLVARHAGGGCEGAGRTDGLCELARDNGPVNAAIRLEGTGDARFSHAGAHGLRAFGGDLPAYGDLRIRIGAGENGGELLVQMTSADAFGLGPETTLRFTRVADAATVDLEAGRAFEARRYEARPDDRIGGSACESWAKDDSLLRQRGDAALTARLDAILAAQNLSVSGHPMDRQCKAMLDAIAALGDGAGGSGGAPVDPAPVLDPQAEVGGSLWRGRHYVFSGGTLSRWEQLDRLALLDDAFEGRLTIDGDGLHFTPTDGAERFADAAHGDFQIGAPARPLARDGRTFAGSFDKLFDDLKGAAMPDASTRLRLPYPDGAFPRDHVGDDAELWLRRYTFAYVSTDGLRMFVGHEEAFGVFRYFLLTKVEDTPRPPPQADASGAWTRVGAAHRDVPFTFWDIWEPVDDFLTPVAGFEIETTAQGPVLVAGGRRIGPLRRLDKPAFGSGGHFAGRGSENHLRKSLPETGSASALDWLCCDQVAYVTAPADGAALALFPGLSATGGMHDSAEVLVSIGASRAAVAVSSMHATSDSSIFFALFQRSGGAPAPVPGPGADGAPAPAPAPQPQRETASGSDPADLARSPVCLALERRAGELNAAGGPSMVQLVRGVYADVGLAFGGAETEAACQRALDRLSGLALLAPPVHGSGPARGGDVTTLVDQSTNIHQTSVVNAVVNALVSQGGAAGSSVRPDPCLALQPIARGLSVTGGIELSGYLGDLFLSVGFSTPEAARPADCLRALELIGDLGLEPGDADNMLSVVTLVDVYAPVVLVDGRPARSPDAGASRACAAYEAFSAALLQRADTPLVQFLRGFAISNGFGMGSDRVPDAADCSRMMRELVELGLDPALPDGGWSRAAILLGEAPVSVTPAPVERRRTERYDPRPETTREPLEMRAGFGYIVPRPEGSGIEAIDPEARVVAFFTPDEAALGLVAAPEGAAGFCNEGRLLSTLDAYRAVASLQLLTRRLGQPPRLVLSGRDCGLTETAAELSGATLGDPSYSFPDEYAGADFDRRLDGLGLDAAERALAAATIADLLRELDFEEEGAWHALVTTPDVVEAATGARPPGGGVVLLDARDGAEITRFRIEHGSERE